MRNLDEKYCYFFSVFVIFIVYYFDLWIPYIENHTLHIEKLESEAMVGHII